MGAEDLELGKKTGSLRTSPLRSIARVARERGNGGPTYLPALRPKYSSDCTLVGLGRGQRSAFSPHQRTPDRHTFGPAGDDDPRSILSTPIMPDGMSSPAPFPRRSCRGKRHMVQYIKSDLEFILAADQDRRGARGWPAALRTGRPDPRLQPRLGPAHGRWLATTICCPARNSGARPDDQFPRTARSRSTGLQTARHSIPTVLAGAGNADIAQLQSVEQSQLAGLRLRACARSPTCSSIRRWAIRPRS